MGLSDAVEESMDNPTDNARDRLYSEYNKKQAVTLAVTA